MFAVGETIVSGDLLEKRFVCDLTACKGACCVAGESGAPLEKEELPILKRIYNKVKPFLTEEGKKAIAAYGTHMVDSDGDYVTPLVNGDLECAYTVFENGVAKCGIEKAWEAGAVSFRKPVSCHLYPVRIDVRKNMVAVNYHKWDICKAACSLGKKLDVPVYKFLREPLIRRFGRHWYSELEETASVLASSQE
ncbi:MAG TPA: DUF3109 family protein [Bacteroidia bacterium]|nr:DUF3109 family protein [Bacteroidia bacterium]